MHITNQHLMASQLINKDYSKITKYFNCCPTTTQVVAKAKTTTKAKVTTTVPVCREYYHEEIKHSNTTHKVQCFTWR